MNLDFDLSNLGVALRDLGLNYPIMNAAGTCRTPEEVRSLAENADTGAIMVGSMTMAARAGNSGETAIFEQNFSLNARGLPDRGAAYWRIALPGMAEAAHAFDKKLIASAAGFNPGEYADLAYIAFESGADGVELNFGCPNVWDGGKQKRILSFSLGGIEETLTQVENAIGAHKTVGIKVSPFSDPEQLNETALVISGFPWVTFVTTMNTFPNATAYAGDKPAISPNGFGGLAGLAIKQIGLGQVRMWKAALPKHMHVIGVGGIESGRDMLDYLTAGATVIQVATAYLRQEDPRIFQNILSEYLDLTNKHQL